MEDRLKHALQLLKEAEEILRQLKPAAKGSKWEAFVDVWKANVTVMCNSMHRRLYPK